MVGKCGARRRYIRLHHMKDIHNNGWGVYWVSRWIYLFIVWRHPASLRLRAWSGSCWAENHRIKSHYMRLHGYTAQLLLDIITWCPGSLSSNTNKILFTLTNQNQNLIYRRVYIQCVPGTNVHRILHCSTLLSSIRLFDHWLLSSPIDAWVLTQCHCW